MLNREENTCADSLARKRGKRKKGSRHGCRNQKTNSLEKGGKKKTSTDTPEEASLANSKKRGGGKYLYQGRNR